MAAKKAKIDVILNPLVKSLFEEINNRNSSVPEFSRETGISSGRIYKWKQEGTTPKEDDAKLIRAWLKKEKSPNQELLHEEDFSKFKGLMFERFTQLEANIRALNSLVIDLKHKVTGESVTKISLELEKTSREVADMIYDELQKKFSHRN